MLISFALEDMHLLRLQVMLTMLMMHDSKGNEGSIGCGYIARADSKNSKSSISCGHEASVDDNCSLWDSHVWLQPIDICSH